MQFRWDPSSDEYTIEYLSCTDLMRFRVVKLSEIKDFVEHIAICVNQDINEAAIKEKFDFAIRKAITLCYLNHYSLRVLYEKDIRNIFGTEDCDICIEKLIGGGECSTIDR
jgi:hypothetical protein